MQKSNEIDKKKYYEIVLSPMHGGGGGSYCSLDSTLLTEVLPSDINMFDFRWLIKSLKDKETEKNCG